MFSSGGDTFGHFAMSHEEAVHTDWTALIGQWLEQVAHRYGPGASSFSGHHDRHGHHGRGHRGGSGIGGAVGGAVVGAAAGFAGGMIMGEVFEDVFDGGDDGGEE